MDLSLKEYWKLLRVAGKLKNFDEKKKQNGDWNSKHVDYFPRNELPAFKVLVFESDLEFWIIGRKSILLVDIPTQMLLTTAGSIDHSLRC